MTQFNQTKSVHSRNRRNLLTSGLALSLVLVLSACSKESFGPAGSINGISRAACSPGEQSVTLPTKILFVVDQSGSNFSGPYDTPGSATDPHKLFRTGTISNFFSAHASQTNLAWSFLAFNNTSAVSLMPSSYFGTAANFSAALGNFAMRPDAGATPYKAAFASAQANIQQDLLTAPANQNYLITFLTDGYPTDYCPGGPTQYSCPGLIMDSQIQTDVTTLVSQAPGRIQFNTVYYGPTDTEAQTRLANMAVAGGGQFVNANLNQNVNLNDTLTIPTACQ